ncbi:hypothetical protein CDFC105_43951 [Clostridioides difficile]|nr:hypothetical protein CDFC105_43951 [Clostridioides difficile]
MYKRQVKQGDMVKQGDVLVNVDLKRIHELGKSTLTMVLFPDGKKAVSYTHLRAHETRHDLVCRLLLEKKKKYDATA